MTSFGDEHNAQGPKWSPNGLSIVFCKSIEGRSHVFVIGANEGAPRSLMTDPGNSQLWPCWSRDGQFIYFRSHRSGASEIWKMPATGGDAVRVTRRGGALPEESPDGNFLYYTKGYPDRCSLWRMPTRGGEETMVADSMTCETPYAVAKEGVYFFRDSHKKDQVDVCFLPLPTGKTRKLLTIERAYVGDMTVSPDGRTILYSQPNQTGSDLMLVENFH